MNELLTTVPPQRFDYLLDQEVNTGKIWYDGSPIYRVVNKYENTAVVNSVTNIIDNSRFNIKQVIHSEAILYSKPSDDCFIPLPSQDKIIINNTNYLPTTRYYYRRHGNIITYFNSNDYLIGGYVIFITEYIKNNE